MDSHRDRHSDRWRPMKGCEEGYRMAERDFNKYKRLRKLVGEMLRCEGETDGG